MVLAGALLSWIPLAFVAYLLSPQPGDPVNCGGIGFGETLCGWDAVGFTFLYVGPPFFLIVLTALTALTLAGPRAQLARVAVSLTALVLPWGLAVISAVGEVG
ncbi:MAG TPA: hypothetical protein VK988_01185 [Acidimicrobiales bacterium]|nr:hypothetical protein [Acidimicrobiales bacterium]